MKKILLLLCLTGIFASGIFAQDDDMKKWMDYMTPAKEHQGLAKLNGDWTYTSKMWMDPSAEPQTSSGTAKFEMLLGNRYSQMKVFGKMMGMDFEGIGVTGYDNAAKKYYSTWVDNFGTGIMLMEGVYDETSKKYVYTGKYNDPMTGGVSTMKETIKIIDDNTFDMEMFSVVDGKDVKNMEMHCTRK